MREALGQAAVAAGKNVAWFTLEQVGALVRRHRADDSVTIARILRADLVVVPPPSTGSCATPTSARPAATASASARPSPERE